MLALVVVACVMVVSEAFGWNPTHYPNLLGGWGGNFYNYNPGYGYGGCSYWCRSFYTSQYYCCQTPNQAIAGLG